MVEKGKSGIIVDRHYFNNQGVARAIFAQSYINRGAVDAFMARSQRETILESISTVARAPQEQPKAQGIHLGRGVQALAERLRVVGQRGTRGSTAMQEGIMEVVGR